MEPDKLVRIAEAIERATKAQAQLIDDLLDISRIVAGKLRLEQRSVDLTSVARAAVDSVRQLGDRKGLSMEIEGVSTPWVFGDPGRLQQVFANLLTNAIKFTPEFGHVVVTLDIVGRSARLVVQDDGVGIDAEFLPRIFHRFTQEAGPKPRTHAGLGLGLAIVHHMIEAHGGTVTADSAGKDLGATFTVLLPLLEGPVRVESADPPVGPMRELRGLKVLVVEDDPDTLQGLAEMLGSVGVVVDKACSAKQAMARFEARRPDLVISDISMPDEGGYELIGRIRALGPAKGGDVPALALTALSLDEDRRSALRAGFDAHLPKPVALVRLVMAMADVLGQAAGFADFEPDATGFA